MTEPAPGRRRRPRRWRAALLCVAGALAAALALLQAPAGLVAWQEQGLDALVLAVPVAPQASGRPVVVVDIGARDDRGANWDRTASARLAAAIARAGPAAVGWDIVFAGNCDPAALPNVALAAGLTRAPTVLGFLMSGAAPVPAEAVPPPALAVADAALAGLWPAPAAEYPCPVFASAAAGLASISLPGDATARVRVVPVAVSVAGQPRPSLPVEVLRLAGALPTPLITADSLHLGAAQVPLGPAATLRFRARGAADRALRTLPAEAVLAGTGADRLAGAIVLVGSSLPARGGLRPTAADPLYPSVQIAADVVQGLQGRSLPWRPAHAPLAEAGFVLLAGLAAGALVALAPPLAAFLGGVTLALAWAGGAALLHARTGALYDPVLPPLALLASANAGLLLQAARAYRAERALRGRMGQLLPGPVIQRLVDEPGLLRLRGERRQVTALFTDIEGFSALTNTLEPEALIAALDRYFAVVSSVILRHGGMIDKIVGDAVHALFNAPIDQPGHVDAALAAAAGIVAETRALRASLGIGRTRIGVETGMAILGDVGSGARIDYTAHGPAVNLAARLQEAGKALGPAVIIGPAAAAASRAPLRALGVVEVRSFGPLALATLDDGP